MGAVAQFLIIRYRVQKNVNDHNELSQQRCRGLARFSLSTDHQLLGLLAPLEQRIRYKFGATPELKLNEHTSQVKFRDSFWSNRLFACLHVRHSCQAKAPFERRPGHDRVIR
jgi:hypothetical protein